ncbi:hypothetical protein SAMN05421505_11259 [Sinosporangium album]|uniref:Uncharacterized protein n=1 Tax=Sinosporangium album TaxID=504805 RepID=A0A1G8A8R4_9ACTN|nr:hypothetical protein [Sinosporangium album]SDH17308.1 hypothetical protein SAMN05421505_11259 [Sinosporangium album]
MPIVWMLRFGAVCGVVMALSLGVPGAIEVFTGETAATSLVIGLGAGLGAPALTAFHLHQSAFSGRFGAIAYGVNMIGFSLFAGIAFALNVVVFFLDPAVATQLLAGPTRIVLLTGVAVFVVGTALFCASMVRARVFPRVPAWGYGVTLVLLALSSSLPDTPLTGALHVFAAGSLIWLSLSLRQDRRPGRGRQDAVVPGQAGTQAGTPYGIAG